MDYPLAFVEECTGFPLAFALAFASAFASAFAYMDYPLASRAFALALRACIGVEVLEEQAPERVWVYIEVDLALELGQGKAAELELGMVEEQAQECTNERVKIS